MKAARHMGVWRAAAASTNSSNSVVPAARWAIARIVFRERLRKHTDVERSLNRLEHTADNREVAGSSPVLNTTGMSTRQDVGVAQRLASQLKDAVILSRHRTKS